MALALAGCGGDDDSSDTADADRTTTSRAAPLTLRDEDAASDALPELRRAVIGSIKVAGAASGFEPHSVPAPAGLGDEAPRGATFTGDYSPLVRDVTFYLYAWRRANVVALVTTTDALREHHKMAAREAFI